MLKMKKQKQGLKKLGRDQFIQNVLNEVNKKGFAERKLKKGGDISSLDLKEAFGQVRYEFLVFSEPDGSEKVRIAKKRKQSNGG